MLRITLFAALAALSVPAALDARQDTGVLRIRVVLADATGALTPIPRVLLLVSDNPATDEPKRVRTTADGTVELKLKAGSYTIESDEAISFGGSAYTWTEDVDVVAGRQIVLDLTANNAAVEAVGAGTRSISADSAVLLSKWQDSVVEIWTPTAHASGFIVDSKGLIATGYRALGGASDVEVEVINNRDRVKVAGAVVQADRLTGAAIVWIDPQAIANARPLAPNCNAAEHPTVAYRNVITALTAPMFSGRELADGEVSKVTSQAIFADLRLVRDTAGAPVFTSTGELLGISGIEEENDGSRRSRQAFVVPVGNLCQTLAEAAKKINGAPPRGLHLPLEPARAGSAVLTKAPAKQQPISLSSSDFDITLLTPDLVRSAGAANPRTDLANWTDYVRDAPPMLLIRVSPQFEESFWKTLARGAASTQGVALPPLKSFTSNFLKMRAYCGDTEVTPIHPFVIERPVGDKGTIREGLYAFDINALGPHCASVRLAMSSEKSPNGADVKTIDSKLFTQITGQ
jgi:S1-C subfamily serine protease